MRLPAADRGDGIHRHIGRAIIGIVAFRPKVIGRGALIRGNGAGDGTVRMGGHFARDQGMVCLPAPLAQGEVPAHMYRHGPLKIGQRKVDPAIAAIGRAKDGEQRLVLVNRQELPIGHGPTLGGKIEGTDFNFA